jgi:predicted nucleic acid-binding protein
MDHLADTNWLSKLQSEIYHGKQGPAQRLLKQGRVHVNPISVAEFLSGGPIPARRKIIAMLRKLPATGYADAVKAAELRYQHRKAGKTLGLPDALMAATAMRRRLQLLTADKDYSGIPGLDWSGYRD